MIFDYATKQVTSSQTSSTCNVSSILPHLLKLKVGVSIILLNNQYLRNELLNGTRLAVRGLDSNYINAELINSRNKGKFISIYCTNMEHISRCLAFKMKCHATPS
jgi:hypothetical protein